MPIRKLFIIALTVGFSVVSNAQRINCNSPIDFVAAGVKIAYINQSKHNGEYGAFYTVGLQRLRRWHYFGANISYLDSEYVLKAFPKFTASYNMYKNDKNYGLTAKLIYLNYKFNGLSNRCFTPEIGLSFYGITSITYGYNILGSNIFELSKHQISFNLYIPVWFDSSDNF